MEVLLGLAFVFVVRNVFIWIGSGLIYALAQMNWFSGFPHQLNFSTILFVAYSAWILKEVVCMEAKLTFSR